ncbi:unnamed protein product [Paramecium sonneborni]|uniref:Acyltransferase 3 domain-containing protein n=1 Tax=Paramecium sonneborni TaxID=65129 RepID=A0A8S1KXJ1_9CILI|nr:unnamed protein product [Paramecium sonneborni]
MEWFLIIVTIAMAFLLLVVNFYLLVLYCHLVGVHHQYATIFVINGMTLTWAQVLMLPLDAANSRGLGEGLDMDFFWKFIYMLILIFGALLIPFAQYYYESDDEKSLGQRCCTALYQQLCFVIIIALLLFISYAFLRFADIPIFISLKSCSQPTVFMNSDTPFTGVANSLQEDSEDTLEYEVSFPVYVMAFMSLFGYCLFLLFGGVGLTALPVDLIQEFINRPKKLTSAEGAQKKEVQEEKHLNQQMKAIKLRMIKKMQQYKMRKKQSENIIYQIQNAVLCLDRDYEIFKLELKYFDKNPIIWYFKFIIGIIICVISFIWWLHILLFIVIRDSDGISASPFLYKILFGLEEGNAGFLCVGIFGFLCVYLLWCTQKGNIKFGLRIPFLFSLHIMKVNETWMNTFLFNVQLMLICSVACSLILKFSIYVSLLIYIQTMFLKSFYWFGQCQLCSIYLSKDQINLKYQKKLKKCKNNNSNELNNNYQMFILIFITQVLGSCISSIGNLMADTLTDPKLELAQLAPYIYFSGKGINDFGLYEDCTNQYQYAVIQFFVPTTPASVNVGICFTKSCSITDINSSIQTVKKWILAVAQEITQVDLTEYELKFLDSQIIATPQSSTYLLISFLIAFFLLQIFVTCFHKQQQPQLNQQQIQLEYQSQQRNIQEVSTYFDEEEQFIKHINQNIQNNKSRQLNEFYELNVNFNLKINYQECLKPQESKYYSLNGIRLLGFLMCVFGNTGISMLLQCDFYQVQHYSKHYILLIVFGCLYSVEIFLWLSGFFAVFSLIKLNCVYHLLLRIWKIWPLMVLIILINTQIIPYLGDGPRWFYIDRYTKCGKWWQNILFINNFDDENYCTLWLWQLSLDVQLTIICAIIIVLYKRNKNIAIILTIILLVVSQSYVIYTCIQKQYGIPYFAAFTTDIYKSFYYRPWFRAPPYFIGMLTAFFVINFKRKLKLWFQNTIQIIGFIIIVYLTVGWYDTMQFGADFYPKLYSQIYEGIMRTVYAIGITLFVLPNLLGNNNLIYKLFNYTPIKYIVKFTFAGYLLHMLIIEVIIASFYKSLDFNVQSIGQVYVGCICIIAIFSFLFRWIIELPFQIKHQIIEKPQFKQYIQKKNVDLI